MTDSHPSLVKSFLSVDNDKVDAGLLALLRECTDNEKLDEAALLKKLLEFQTGPRLESR